MKLLKSDRRALVFLVLVALVAISLMVFKDAVFSNDDVANDATEPTDSLVTNLDSIRDSLGSFDPNEVDSVTLTKYGLGAIQIRSLMGYRRRGGRFESPLAVSKLYNWSDEDVEKVIDHIVIGDKYKQTYNYRDQYEAERRKEYEQRQERYANERSVRKAKRDSIYKRERVVEDTLRYARQEKFKELTKVNINTADTTLLRKIPGVGRGISNAIVRLRNKLGGFYSVEQLAEIDYISPGLYEWFEVGQSDQLHLININKASFQVLNAHPYVSYNQARELMNYRRLYGDIKDRDGLVATHIFTQKEVERLAPYLEY